ncbi:MAG: D-alanyl-D-alanine carboxypeptidase [Candidatus Moranbacteria bacterium]|nr:D-alanyl-D-alanine carboxypeptidase [Candidatus Moranbacteria bacterium]MDD3964862.1 D-alanyl-D-alanine carboxypeptidase [Candidatus Moranbacteria bacterium]
MHKAIVFLTSVIIILFLTISDGEHFLARGESFLGLFRMEDTRFSDTSFESRQIADTVYVTEDRSFACGFVPELKTYAPNLSIVSAHASVILDVDSGNVLYEKNANEERQIASLTKLFTATIVMERVKNLDELVTIDEEAVYAEGTRIGCPRSGFCNSVRLKVGEKISVKNLLKAALMNSANDSAIALGKHIGKTQAGFANIMNARAKELGLEHSHFCTPSGLELDGREAECYSSALDMAKITVHALSFPEIWEIMRIEKDFIASSDGVYEHEIFNTNKLLGQLPNLVGTKTGFTPLAGYSLLAVATDESRSHRVVAVLLDDPNRWQSIRSMFDWSFQSVSWR